MATIKKLIDRKTAATENDIHTDEDVESIATHPTLQDPPDGGRGWLVVVGCFFGLFSTQGVWYSWGTFLAYYNEHMFPQHMTELSWIGSLWLAMSVILGPFFNYLAWRIGYFWLLVAGALCSCLGFMMASLASEIWHLYLTQGFLLGLGASLVWFPCISAPQSWFMERRGLAVGLAMAGSGCGGLVFNNVAQALMKTVGIHWAMRILGFIVLVLLAFSTQVVRPLNPPRKPGFPVTLVPFKNVQFCILFVIQVITNFAFNIPSTFLPSYAQHVGSGDWTATNMSAIMSGIMVVGKVGSGWASDRIGRANMNTIVIMMAGLLCLVLWLPAKNEATVWAFAALFGVFGGGYMAMIPSLLVQVVGADQLEAANGLVFFGWLFGGIFGSPISSTLIDENGPDGPQYWRAIVFGGVMMFGAGVLALVVKIMRGGFNPFRKV
ncbi:major facilitator superfamily domain-containing protein [Zychaea mexicana]|uniref:major facilitator superfamily domain-containing protein n=1 Tax=Zychaea mexicana TaxID=64656 RepID=UPI0022FE64BC|nr:major facilitator superfamily domain-containing protein [Zychaea mexicana]KAI9488801.1 major facilitator superfamily domain-containing protein [Zychaea mexicana]